MIFLVLTIAYLLLAFPAVEKLNEKYNTEQKWLELDPSRRLIAFLIAPIVYTLSFLEF